MTDDEKVHLWNSVRDKYFRPQHMTTASCRNHKLCELLGKLAWKEYKAWRSGNYYPMDDVLKTKLLYLNGPYGEGYYAVLKRLQEISKESKMIRSSFYPLESDEKILELLRDICPKQYQVLMLYYGGDRRSYLDIARGLGVPEGTVKSRLSRARNFVMNHRAAALVEHA